MLALIQCRTALLALVCSKCLADTDCVCDNFVPVGLFRCVRDHSASVVLPSCCAHYDCSLSCLVVS